MLDIIIHKRRLRIASTLMHVAVANSSIVFEVFIIDLE